jgi:ABC transport system ATP-binding/permease protein
LLGKLAPDAGEIKLGTNLKIAYFDQLRAVCAMTGRRPKTSPRARLCRDQRQASTSSATCRISCSRPNAPARRSKLSGGERNRLLLARLFARPSNLLVMDEPTNDLDAETLELLEELVADYPGTLLLVSHDREFLDNVVTATFVMEGEGQVGEYVGGYSDWLRQRRPERPQPEPARVEKAAAAAPQQPRRKPAKLSYKLARELEQLPAQVEALEAKMAELTEQMNDPGFYRQDAAAITRHNSEVEALQSELDAAYSRWEELESRAG